MDFDKDIETELEMETTRRDGVGTEVKNHLHLRSTQRGSLGGWQLLPSSVLTHLWVDRCISFSPQHGDEKTLEEVQELNRR